MGVEQYILIGLIVLLVIAYPLLVSSRNKKDKQRMEQQTNSLKRGDKVLLTSGVYGKIIDIEQDGERRLITIETGSGKNKGYVTVDAYAIFQVIVDQPAPAPEAKPVETKTETTENAEAKVEEVAEQPAEKKSRGHKSAEPQTDDTTASIEAQVTGKKTRAKK